MTPFVLSPSDEGIYENSRLAIYNIIDKTFHATIEIKENDHFTLKDKQIIDNPYDFKYKYQIKKNGKWQDATRYHCFVKENKLNEFFLGELILEEDQLDKLIIKYINGSTGMKFNDIKTAIVSLMRDVWRNGSTEHKAVKNFLNVLNKHDLEPGSLWHNLSFYLEQMIKIKNKFTELKLHRTHYDLLRKEIQSNDDFLLFLKDRLRECNEQNLQMAHVLSGSINSLLGNRKEASFDFKQAIQYKPDYILQLSFDTGLNTYREFNKPKLYSNEILFLSQQKKSQNKITILLSLDVRFLRLYSIPLFYAIIALKNYHFHFHVIGEFEESRLVTNQALKLFDKMSAFININASPIKPSFSTERCPDFVKEAKTFYACARFINAVYFMEYFNTDLLIIDADMFINDDIAPYLNKLSQYDITLAFTSGIMNLSPWRRVMAGNVYLKNKPVPKHFMNTVKEYIIQNLDNPISWTLDQNALTYAYEALLASNLAVNVGNSALLHRPMNQPLIRKLIEDT